MNAKEGRVADDLFYLVGRHNCEELSRVIVAELAELTKNCSGSVLGNTIRP
jgi:hypothetical protein